MRAQLLTVLGCVAGMTATYLITAVLL